MDEFSFYLQTSKTPPIRTTSELLKDLLTEGNLECGPDGIRLIAVDISRTVLTHLKLEACNFEEYHCPGNVILGLNMLDFHKIIKTMENTDTLKLYVRYDNPNILGIDMYTKEKNTLNSWELNLMDLQYDDIEIPPIKFESVITMKSSHFQKICRDMHNFSEKIEIQSVGSELSFTGCNVNIKQHTRVKPTPDGMKYIQNDNPTEVIQGIFDLKFLVLFSKCTNLSSDIHIHIKNDYPLVLKCDVASLGEIKLCLAPQNEECI